MPYSDCLVHFPTCLFIVAPVQEVDSGILGEFAEHVRSDLRRVKSVLGLILPEPVMIVIKQAFSQVNDRCFSLTRPVLTIPSLIDSPHV